MAWNSSSDNHGPIFTCRSRRLENQTEAWYNLDPAIFNIFTCKSCANYLNIDAKFPYLPDPTQNLDILCTQLNFTDSDCFRWKKCCDDALHCCQTQVDAQNASLLLSTTTAENANLQSKCPQVWDGYSCIPSVSAGSTFRFACPNFLSLNYKGDESGIYHCFIFSFHHHC